MADRSITEAAGRRAWLPAAVVGGVVTVLALVGSLLIGLNVGYTAVLLVLLGAGTFAVDRWRRRRASSPTGFGTALAETAVVAVVLFGLLQVVPYGQVPANPPVTGEPAWDSPQTRALAVRACYDCHSNETEQPWYASVAPISWAVSDHVRSGRSKLNFSEFDQPQRSADESAEVTQEGEMPPGYYTRFGLHATADLTDQELAQLVAGFRATPGLSER